MKRIGKYILIIAGIYIVYFITGVILVQLHVVDKWHIAPGGIFTNTGGSHHGTAAAGVDGPYIFYTDNNTIIKSIIRSGTGYKGVSGTFDNKSEITIICNFEENARWNFTTTLRDTIGIEPSTYPEPDSLIAISDIEGEFGAFRKLLIANNVINEDYEWTFGTGHLVLAGDFFDRGIHVTETLWLIYHLEQQAMQHLGKVHFTLGNHELMNMQDDIRYVSNKYLENAKLIDTDYKAWFDQGTELGNWLATKNVIERIGKTLFVHAGIAKEINDLSLSIEAINEKCRQYYFTNKEQLKTIPDENTRLLFASATSPFWYRGYPKQEADQEQVNTTLKQYNANKIVIGHTTVDNVSTYYNGHIINIDTKHAQGNSQGLFYSSGIYYKISMNGTKIKL